MRMIRPAERVYRSWTADSRQWDAYEPRENDIFITSAPKCGTTWMQQIVSSLVFQDAAKRALSTVSPWVDARHHGYTADIHQRLKAQTHRRFPKTHLPIDGLPLFDDIRYIHVARDGRDALMSMHNYYTGFNDKQLEQFDRIGLEDPTIGRPFPRVAANPAEYFRDWIATPTDLPMPSFFDLEVGYWAERKRPNFLLVHHNDLLRDLDGEMRRISAFLDIVVNEPIWPNLVQAAVFEEMQAAGDTLMPGIVDRFVDGSRRMFNKGTNGRWRGVLSDGDLALYEAKVHDKFSPGLAAWIEGGRLGAGDPSGLN